MQGFAKTWRQLCSICRIIHDTAMSETLVTREAQAQAQVLTSPAPFGLIACTTVSGCDNLTAVSWWTYLSNQPPMLAVSLSQHSFSRDCIKQNREFTLSVVDQSLTQAALQCGKYSGRTVDKVKKFQVEMTQSMLVKPGFVSKSRVSFECRVIQDMQTGDHTLFVAEILQIHTDPSCCALYAVNGYRSLAPVEFPDV